MYPQRFIYLTMIDIAVVLVSHISSQRGMGRVNSYRVKHLGILLFLDRYYKVHTNKQPEYLI